MTLLEMNDDELLARLRNEEDNFVERKTVSDINDCVKTVIAFANTAPIGMACVLFIGVTDEGEFEKKQIDFDSIQKSVNNKLKGIYPRVPYVSKVISQDADRVLAVIVPGSELRPHFAGASYIRAGSQSEEASKAQLDNLVAQRSSKVYRISQYIGQPVTVEIKFERGNRTFSRANWNNLGLVVVECNESWVTLAAPDGSNKHSLSLSSIELNYDPDRERLKIHATLITD